MKEWTSKNKDVHHPMKEENTSSTGLTSRALPETQSLSKAEKEQVGVSTHCTLSGTDSHQVDLQKGIRLSGSQRRYRLLPYHSGRKRSERNQESGYGIAIAQPLLCLRNGRGNTGVCIRQRQPALLEILLQALPRGKQNPQDTDDCSRPGDRKSQNHLRFGGRRYHHRSQGREEIQGGTEGESHRWQVQRGGRKSGKIPGTAESGGHRGRCTHHGYGISAYCLPGIY